MVHMDNAMPFCMTSQGPLHIDRHCYFGRKASWWFSMNISLILPSLASFHTLTERGMQIVFLSWCAHRRSTKYLLRLGYVKKIFKDFISLTIKGICRGICRGFEFKIQNGFARSLFKPKQPHYNLALTGKYV